MKVLISAAETSSDAHGAELLKALRSEWTLRRGVTEEVAAREIDAFGIGGPRLRQAGLRVLVDARDLLAMGFLEIIGHLPKILRALRVVDAASRREKPDLAIVIDYPDFHFRLARRLRAQGIPVIYFIPPKVWAWRKGRIRILKELFSKILCILPFEEEFYRQENVPATYVGNPLVDELPVDLSREDARGRLNISLSEKVLLLMPGSRASELKRHLELFLEGALNCADSLAQSGVRGPLKVLIPFAGTANLPEVTARITAWSASQKDLEKLLSIRVSQNDSAVCMLAADAGLIKSGTSTLEAGFLGCPHCIIYKTNWITAWIFKFLIRYQGPVGLVNLVYGWTPGKPYLVQEILLEAATARSLGAEALQLFSDEKLRLKLLTGFEKLRKILLAPQLTSGKGPSRQAAREILEFMERTHP
ncbi:MAG: lipid-A-disaccharide synthase [Bdellovibrionales bacterium GWB1_52_6]|nr:MAG: lipid-A-disaccharide synthase [Bdellovibrionales bacterium GWB1_52_6]OFZ03662.1 MAG: lipid-A-disaccharide synthase [Bdellovibrionales bacterium GWA1_52_35]HCM40613.1 lipid-A-disaccharide synthase [Bdellovibrionales bacterium]